MQPKNFPNRLMKLFVGLTMNCCFQQLVPVAAVELSIELLLKHRIFDFVEALFGEVHSTYVDLGEECRHLQLGSKSHPHLYFVALNHPVVLVL